jgi:hypothetical protein
MKRPNLTVSTVRKYQTKSRRQKALEIIIITIALVLAYMIGMEIIC